MVPRKKLLNFRVEMLSFATSQRSVSQQASVWFAAIFKAEPQTLHQWAGLQTVWAAVPAYGPITGFTSFEHCSWTIAKE